MSTFAFIDSGLPYEKLKMLFLNIFFVMCKAATLNLRKLDQNITEVHVRLQMIDRTFTAYALSLLITLFLLMNFIIGYCGMAAHIIAVFPILTDELPELLLPTLVIQLAEYIGLTLTEFTLGIIVTKHVLADCSKLLVPFILRLVIKTIIGLSVFNTFADFYIKLNSKHMRTLSALHSEERLIRKEILT